MTIRNRTIRFLRIAEALRREKTRRDLQRQSRVGDIPDPAFFVYPRKPENNISVNDASRDNEDHADS